MMLMLYAEAVVEHINANVKMDFTATGIPALVRIEFLSLFITLCTLITATLILMFSSVFCLLFASFVFLFGLVSEFSGTCLVSVVLLSVSSYIASLTHPPSS